MAGSNIHDDLAKAPGTLPQNKRDYHGNSCVGNWCGEGRAGWTDLNPQT